jgi:hypothetical protein
LAQLLPDGTETVVVKHTKGFVSANRNFELDVERCVGFVSFRLLGWVGYAWGRRALRCNEGVWSERRYMCVCRC